MKDQMLDLASKNYPLAMATRAGINAEHGDQLSGRIVVDTTVIISALPISRVSTACNTTIDAPLDSGTVGETATTICPLSNHRSDKTELAGINTSGGLRAIDAGSL